MDAKKLPSLIQSDSSQPPSVLSSKKNKTESAWMMRSQARTGLTFLVGLTIFTVLCYYIGLNSFRSENPYDFIKTDAAKFKDLTTSGIVLEYTKPLTESCETSDRCLAALRSDSTTLLVPKAKVPHFDIEPSTVGLVPMLVTFTVRPDGFHSEYTHGHAHLSLPRFRFQQAEVYIDGHFERRFFSGERVQLPIHSWRMQQESFAGEVLLYLAPDDADAFINWDEPTFLTDMVGIRIYSDYAAMKERYPVRQIGLVLKVSLAIFALLLFLIIDSSSEVLGLAMLMGFGALASMFSRSDLAPTWLPPVPVLTFFEYLFHALSESFRLYFFWHLSRRMGVPAQRWFGFGIVASVVYAGILYASYGTPWTWQAYFMGFFDAAVSFAGLFLMLPGVTRQGWRLAPWKSLALALASISAFANIADILCNYPVFLGSKFGVPYWLTHSVSTLQANSAYLLIVAAFVNISTLESRVRTLSRDKIEAEHIARDLELGQSVQRAFLEIPRLPPSIRVESFHEPAVYVSGDTYYVNWQESRGRFVCILNDVTGHGVQAALKAFGCTVMARSLWQDDQADRRGDDRRVNERLSRYDEVITDLICTYRGAKDLNAMCGVELDNDTGIAHFYRANYRPPMLFEPAGDRWVHVPLTMLSHTTLTRTLVPGSIILLMSDGIIDSARSQRDLIAYLMKRLPPPGDAGLCEGGRRVLIEYISDEKNQIHDDRTFVIVEWNPKTDPAHCT